MTSVHTGMQLLADLPENLPRRQRAELLQFVREYAPALHQLAMDDVARLQLQGRLDDDAFRAAVRELVDADPREWVERQPLVRRLAADTPSLRSLVTRRMCRRGAR